MPGNTPTGLLPTVLPRGSTDTGEHTSAGPPDGTPPGRAPAAAPVGAAAASTAAPQGAAGVAGVAGARARHRPGRPADGLAARASGHVDVWDIWSPFVEQAEAQDHARLLVSGVGYGSPYSFTVASRGALQDPAKAAAIRDYLKLLAQAHAWAATHQAAWAAVWAKASGLSAAIMAKAAKDDAARAVPITPAVVASEQQVSNAFTAAGLIPGHVDFSKFVDTAFNSTAGGTS